MSQKNDFISNKTMNNERAPLERVILVAVDTGKEDTELSLDELTQLVDTAGATVVGRMVQPRDSFNPATYIGKGKIEELQLFINTVQATGIITDDELTPAQMKNLEDILDVKVCDRTMLILDIFATRATSKEGKIQVELAMLRYEMTRLAGHGVALSRLGGGIGTRGPGETKLETDKRVIRGRITHLKSELNNIVSHRNLTREKRIKNSVPVIAIVGYTNAGKSTLLNTLTNAGILSEDKLFATLDPTTRSYSLSNGTGVLLTDTVGFINKLPHHLIDAFRSTLEEAKYADIIVHVVDASNPNRDAQMQVVYDTLNKLNVIGKPIITLFNKCDLPDSEPVHRDAYASKIIDISAVTGQGLDELGKAIIDTLRSMRTLIDVTLSYSDGALLQDIRTCGELLLEEYLESGIHIKAQVPNRLAYLDTSARKGDFD